MTAEEKSRYFEEVGRALRRGGFEVGSVDEDGLLPVSWQGQPLCQVAEEGVRYQPGDVSQPDRGAARDEVLRIAETTAGYMKLMETAPPLKASGLEGDYRLLAEFGRAVLAGHPTGQGVEFVTWERDYDRTGVLWGHYFGEDYGTAKLDFATRSGLVERNLLFSAEQLTEIYRAVNETLESGYPITAERERTLEGVAGQIEYTVPELEERVNLSSQKELEQAGTGVQQGMSMTF